MCALKHMVHIRHLGSIEIRDIETGETNRSVKHLTHICHLGGIEAREI